MTMIKKLWLGVRLRCPNCEKGYIMAGFYTLKERCPVCDVRFEKQVGEGTGAMMLTLSLVPFPFIVLSMVLYVRYFPPIVPFLLGIIALMLIATLLFYRVAKGLWVSITYLTSGLEP